MYICNSCGHVFEEHKYIKNGGGDIGEDWPVCPECWDDDCEEARKCGCCEAIKRDVDMCVHVDICVDCMSDISEKAKAALKEALSADEFKAFSEYYELNDKIV